MLARDAWARKQGWPLYSQPSRHIEVAIRSGAISEGDPLPSECEIAQISGLSRLSSFSEDASKALERPHFVPTPRELTAGAGMEQR